MLQVRVLSLRPKINRFLGLKPLKTVIFSVFCTISDFAEIFDHNLTGTKLVKSDVECYTISAVDKAPKIWYNKEQETRKEGKEDGTL